MKKRVIYKLCQLLFKPHLYNTSPICNQIKYKHAHTEIKFTHTV